MVWTCVDSALDQLYEIHAFQHLLSSNFNDHLDYKVWISWKKACLGDLPSSGDPFETHSDMDAYWEEAYRQIESHKRELKFVRMILCCFSTWDDDTDENLTYLLTTLKAMWEELEEQIDDCILWKADPRNQDWDLLASLLESTIQRCKFLILDYFCDSSSFLLCKPLPSRQTLQFLEDVLHNLEVIVKYKADVISPVKNQIDSLKVRLVLSQSFFRFMAAHEDINCEESKAFKLCLQSFAKDAASLAFWFWAESANEQTTFEAKINQLLCDMWQRIIKPCGSDVAPLYLGTLKAINLQPSDDALLYGKIVEGFVDLHLDNLAAARKDDLPTIRKGLIFLLTFMTSPPEGCDHDEQLALLFNQIGPLFRRCIRFIFPPDAIKREHNILLSDFSEKLEGTIEKVEQLCVKIPDLSSYNFPRTNGLGFYYLLLQNLERLQVKLDTDSTFIPFAKNFIIKIKEELVSLRPLVNGIFELQKGQKKYKDTWAHVINLAYLVERVINSCSVCFHPIWYHMACLHDIVHQIEDVKIKLERVGNYEMHPTEVLPHSIRSFSTPAERTWSSTSSEALIHLEKETTEIIEELLGGFQSLGVISIIGMGGLGKTTLAKEVFNSELVRLHFHKSAFCTVSQVHNTRNILIDMLCGLLNCEKSQFDSMEKDDLAYTIHKCLSGHKYLIVMDDIWDVEVWNEVKMSFPDHKMGSRVIFTTRERKVALDAKSSLHDLRPLSDDESFKLLQIKIFGIQDYPQMFSEVGKIIAKNCKGLPLSIVVVAGLLASKNVSPSWCEEIAQATSQFVGQECNNIIGLSYKHLPEQLKSCFLYMGIYEEDELIYAHELRQLWICEGFVTKSTTTSLRSAAKECLSELVDRSLVIAVDTSGRGGTTSVRLHDLIHDFCRRQAKEDNFLWLGDGYVASNSSNSTLGDQYRVSTKMDGRSFVDVKPTELTNMHSLLYHGNVNKLELIMRNLRLIQVLHLKRVDKILFFHHLVHLRYLCIGESNIVWEVPDSICKLWNLETLIVECVLFNMLPKTIWKMKMLRHLEFIRGCVLDVDDNDHEGGHKSLENLEFLSVVSLYGETSARAVLGRLPNIQKLICKLEGSQWKGKVFTIDFLGKLESLKLSIYAPAPAVIFPSSLKRLYFDCGEAYERIEDNVSAISRLPYLEVLTFYGSLKQWDVEDDQFQKLKYLTVLSPVLVEWNVSFDSFSCLEKLQLLDCYNLEEIPACFAVLSTLQRIVVRDCNDKLQSSAIQVQMEHMESGNEVQLEIDGEDVD